MATTWKWKQVRKEEVFVLIYKTLRNVHMKKWNVRTKESVGAKIKNEVGGEITCSQFTLNDLQSTMFFSIEYNAELWTLLLFKI